MSSKELSTDCPHCDDEFLTREKMIIHAISCDQKTWTHETWAAICADCGDRRLLWPINQSISSLSDPKARFIHSNGMEKCQ